MKKKNIVKILIMFIAVSLCLFLKSNVQAMTAEEAGKYVAEFSINFFDAHNSETTWDPSSERKLAYKGEKSSDGKYHFDCVGWVSFAIHQSIGIGNASWTEFGVPAGNGNTPVIGGGYEPVLGTLGSRKKISLEELKQTLKPGDIVFKTAQHVMLYVGDNTIIHSTGQGPGPEYGGDSGYALVKSTLDHYYNEEGFGIEAVARLSESAASAINESNCTTIMGQAGSGLTGVWEKASQGGVGVTSSSSNSSSNLASKLSVTGMNEDLSLGLRYPKDNSNTPLNKFIDFTLPYLQTWMIPLAMNSGIMTKTEDEEGEDYTKNPMFGYLTIKEAMSDVLVERYDITTCTLKTRYKVYDEITYNVSYNAESKKWVKTESSRKSVDESSNGAKAEQYVSKTFDVDTKYYIKKAYTFDVKINNECTYKKYSDSDVENRIENKEGGFETKNIDQNGGSYSEGGDPGPNGDSKDDYSYTIKQGHYVNVTRVWKDDFQPNDNTKIEPYNVDDVKEYIKNGGVKKQTTASYSQTGDVYNCKGYDLTEDEITKLAGLAVGEAGTDEDALSVVISHMANIWEYWEWSKATRYTSRGSLFNAIYWKHSEGGWYDDRSFDDAATDTAKEIVRSVLVEGKRTLLPYIDEFCTYEAKSISPYYGSDTSKYIIGETIVTQLFSGNPSGPVGYISEKGGNIYFCSNPKYKEYCEQNQNFTTTGDGSKSTTTSSVKSLDNFLFLGDDLMYGVKESGKISNSEFVNVVGSTPETWKKWLNGEQDKFDNDVDFSGKKLPDEDKIKGVCMMVGVNALNSDASADQVISDMKEVIDKLCDKYSSVPVYIAKVLHVREGDKCSNASEVNEKIKKFNKEISSYCTSKGALCIDLSNNYVGTDNKLKEDKSKDGIHLKKYDDLAKNIQNAIVGSDVTVNEEEIKKMAEELKTFTISDINYYNLLNADKEINRVDMMNARPENYLKYLEKGAQFSNHVGYSRSYISFSYDELRRLFKEYFDNDKLPYSYGSSLGYETYKADSYILDAGTVSGSTMELLSGNLNSKSSYGSLEKDPNKKNILIIAGHKTTDRELPNSMKYTEPIQNRKMAMAMAGALEKAGLNPVIANRVMAHNAGKGDYTDSYGVLWGDEDTYLNLNASQRKELFAGYDYIIEFHHNASKVKGSAKGALLTYPPGYNVTELDRKLLDCFVNNNLGNTKGGDVVQGLADVAAAKSLGIHITYIECEFYDHDEAMDYIEKNYNKIAEEMAMLLRQHFGVMTPIKSTPSIVDAFSSEDAELLAKCINGEARGESYEGQVAVGAVILNRVKSSEFPNTIREVIYQQNQFSCTKDGQIDLAIDSNSTVKKAAEEALSGVDPTDGALYFFNPAGTNDKWLHSLKISKTIGHHVFSKG